MSEWEKALNNSTKQFAKVEWMGKSFKQLHQTVGKSYPRWYQVAKICRKSKHTLSALWLHMIWRYWSILSLKLILKVSNKFICVIVYFGTYLLRNKYKINYKTNDFQQFFWVEFLRTKYLAILNLYSTYNQYYGSRSIFNEKKSFCRLRY